MSIINEKNIEDIAFKMDNDTTLSFSGRLFAESTSYDEDFDRMTRHKLYLTDDNSQVYTVVSNSGEEKSKRAYKISLDGENCHIDNSKMTMDIPFEMLMLAVRSLCGIEQMPSMEEVEETLRAANS